MRRGDGHLVRLALQLLQAGAQFLLHGSGLLQFSLQACGFHCLALLHFVVLIQDLLVVLQVGMDLILVAQHFSVVLLDLAGQQV